MIHNKIQAISNPPESHIPDGQSRNPQARLQHPTVGKIRDYMIWSIFNICLGGIVFGLIAVLFSYFTMQKKKENDFAEAKKWSTRALACNIVTTILGVISIILVIVLPIALGVGVSVGISGSPRSLGSSVLCTCVNSGNASACTGGPHTCLGSCGITAISCDACTVACSVGWVCTNGSIIGHC